MSSPSRSGTRPSPNAAATMPDRPPRSVLAAIAICPLGGQQELPIGGHRRGEASLVPMVSVASHRPGPALREHPLDGPYRCVSGERDSAVARTGRSLDGRSGAGRWRAGPGVEDALDDRDGGASVPAGPVVGAEAAGVVGVGDGGAADEQRHGDAGVPQGRECRGGGAVAPCRWSLRSSRRRGARRGRRRRGTTPLGCRRRGRGPRSERLGAGRRGSRRVRRAPRLRGRRARSFPACGRAV